MSGVVDFQGTVQVRFALIGRKWGPGVHRVFTFVFFAFDFQSSFPFCEESVTCWL